MKKRKELDFSSFQFFSFIRKKRFYDAWNVLNRIRIGRYIMKQTFG